MVEAERVLARRRGALRPDQPAADQTEQCRRHRLALVRRSKPFDRLARELATGDRCPLDHGALGAVESVEPTREQRLDRRRHRADVEFLLGSKHGELLEEEWVALPGGEQLAVFAA